MEFVKYCTPLLALVLWSSGCKKDADAIGLPAAEAATAPSSSKEPAQEHSTARSELVSNTANLHRKSVFTGTGRPSRTSELTPRVSAKVVKVLAKPGDTVRKGQVLVHLDAGDFRLAMRQAKAARHTARMQVAAVKTEFKRLQGLLRARAIPASQFDKVDAQFKLALAGLAQTEVAVAMATAALAKTSIRAPYTAVVTKKMKDEGSYATVMPPSPILKIEEISTLEVHVQVPEGQMLRVQKGTAVRLRFKAINKTVRANIGRVIPSLNPRTRSFTAIVTLPNPRHELRPGMFVEVTLDTSDKSSR